jgi:hypothetical protein
LVVVRALLKDIAAHIQEGRTASVIFPGAVSLAIGVLNWAAMTECSFATKRRVLDVPTIESGSVGPNASSVMSADHGSDLGS